MFYHPLLKRDPELSVCDLMNNVKKNSQGNTHNHVTCHQHSTCHCINYSLHTLCNKCSPEVWIKVWIQRDLLRSKHWSCPMLSHSIFHSLCLIINLKLLKKGRVVSFYGWVNLTTGTGTESALPLVQSPSHAWWTDSAWQSSLRCCGCSADLSYLLSSGFPSSCICRLWREDKKL